MVFDTTGLRNALRALRGQAPSAPRRRPRNHQHMSDSHDTLPGSPPGFLTGDESRYLEEVDRARSPDREAEPTAAHSRVLVDRRAKPGRALPPPNKPDSMFARMHEVSPGGGIGTAVGTVSAGFSPRPPKQPRPHLEPQPEPEPDPAVPTTIGTLSPPSASGITAGETSELAAVEDILARPAASRSMADLARVFRFVEKVPEIATMPGGTEAKLEFCRNLSLRRHVANAVVCTQGEPSNGARVFLLRGVLKVSIDGTDRWWLQPGASYGGGTSDKPWAATVRAERDSAVSVAVWHEKNAEIVTNKVTVRLPKEPVLARSPTPTDRGAALGLLAGDAPLIAGHPAGGFPPTWGPMLGINRTPRRPQGRGFGPVRKQPPLLVTSPSLQSLYQRSERKRGLEDGHTSSSRQGYHSTQTEWVLSSHSRAPTIPKSLGKHLARSLKWQPQRTPLVRAAQQVRTGMQSLSRTLRGGALEGYHSRRTPFVRNTTPASSERAGMAERGRPLSQSLPAQRWGGSDSFRRTGQSLSGWIGATTGAYHEIRIGGVHNYLSDPNEIAWTPIGASSSTASK